jgi:glycosyltransferase involved in cell wall biosynthesis
MKKILIDTRIADGVAGGMQQYVIGLAKGLAEISPEEVGELEITFLMLEGHASWLEPYLPDFCTILCQHTGKNFSGKQKLLAAKEMLMKKFGHLLGPNSIRIASEPAVVTEHNPDLVHFIHHRCFATDRKSIFSPYDLQHEYYPQYFDQRTLMVRKHRYKFFAQQAASVFCISDAGKKDAVRFLGVPSEKCDLIYLAPTYEAEKANAPETEKFKTLHHLPERFLYFPAKTYPHKNHLGLFKALEKLNQQGLKIPLVCTGSLSYPGSIRKSLRRLGLESQVQLLGWVGDAEVSMLYRLATAMVFPSKFEGFGIPLIEAMSAGLPVTCSNASCIPEVTGDAALLFDPDNPDEMAGCIKRLWTDEALRKELVVKGKQNAGRFSWEHTAREHLKLYRRLLGEPVKTDGTA